MYTNLQQNARLVLVTILSRNVSLIQFVKSTNMHRLIIQNILFFSFFLFENLQPFVEYTHVRKYENMFAYVSYFNTDVKK